MQKNSIKDNIMLGGMLYMAGYLFFAVMSALTKSLQETSGFPTIEITFFSYIYVVVLCLPWMLREGIVKAFKSDNYPIILVRTALGFTTFYLYFMVVFKIPLVNAVTLMNTAPFWVVLLAAIFLKERISRGTILCVIAGFIGVVLVVHPRLQGMNIQGYTLGIIVGAVSSGIVITRRILKNESWQRVILIYSVISTLVSGVIMIPVFKMPHGIEWFYISVVGVCMYLMQTLVMIAAKYAKASTLGPLSYISIVVSGIIGIIFWKHMPSPLTSIGIVIIIASGIMILVLGLREEKTQ